MNRAKNFILISPHFPANFEPFAIRLKANGFNVFGIADEAYDRLSPKLREALTEYYRVDDMNDYEQMYRAVAYFAFKYGRIDRIESNNEHWLETDARLRTDFNVPGLKSEDMEVIKHKSKMKEVFRKHKLPVARGRVITDDKDARKLAKELKFPVIAKPDSGVGASDTWKIKTPKDLDRFLQERNPEVSYIMEEYIPGNIVTYDGLVDQDGKIVFDASITHDKPVLDVVADHTDMYFFIKRDIPEDLRELGQKAVQAFGIKERFFHFEFFRLDNGDLICLEINCRPPGGSTIDLWNYGNDFDIFDQYAQVVKNNEFTAELTRPYHVAYISRIDEVDYVHSHDDIYRHYGDEILYDIVHPGVFAAVMGNIGYVFKTPSEDKLYEILDYISERQTTD
ncbi:ATP-grasp domain-containing protein [Hutsoniella sourekii]|uniref:ATP-grasp domain-containing protein n=1 Tax=Hutsoniella sourekii TaxID=87650 RepID=UPI0004897768|nr:ATP-grasp domain-containing protein [Hutsoniella sourekii]